MIFESFRPIKSQTEYFGTLVNKRAKEHESWYLKLKDIIYMLKYSSKIEKHTISKYYILPNSWYNDSSEYPNLPGLPITQIPSGTYKDIHGRTGGFGNFCLKNGSFYMTVGQKIFQFNPETDEINLFNNTGITKYLWKINWSIFPPKAGSSLEYSSIQRNTDFSAIYPLINGKFALLTWSNAMNEVEVRGMEGRKRIICILKSDLTYESYFELGGEYANNLIDIATIGNQIILLTYKDLTSQVGTVRENILTYFNTNGFYQGSILIKPTIYNNVPEVKYGGFYSGVLSYITSVIYLYVPYEEWLRNKSPDVEVINRGISENGREWVAIRYLRVGDTLDNRNYNQKVIHGAMTSNQQYIFIFDKNTLLIRCFDNNGIQQRVISLQECELFGDKGLKLQFPEINVNNIQISIDPDNTKYLYILFNTYPMLVGRCKIDN